MKSSINRCFSNGIDLLQVALGGSLSDERMGRVVRGGSHIATCGRHAREHPSNHSLCRVSEVSSRLGSSVNGTFRSCGRGLIDVHPY